jgi:hypothetical protein
MRSHLSVSDLLRYRLATGRVPSVRVIPASLRVLDPASAPPSTLDRLHRPGRHAEAVHVLQKVLANVVTAHQRLSSSLNLAR